MMLHNADDPLGFFGPVSMRERVVIHSLAEPRGADSSDKIEHRKENDPDDNREKPVVAREIHRDIV